jgi:hypothetical protein
MDIYSFLQKQKACPTQCYKGWHVALFPLQARYHIKHNGNGFFIEEIQEYALIDIFYLLEKQEDKIVNSMSLKVTEYAQEFFYIRNVVKSYVCLYGELISRRYI